MSRWSFAPKAGALRHEELRYLRYLP